MVIRKNMFLKKILSDNGNTSNNLMLFEYIKNINNMAG